MSEPEGFAALRSAIEAMVGLPAWGPVAGKGTGSMFTLNFGEKLLRDKPLRNRHLSDTVRHYTSERSIFVERAAWRLDGPEGCLCSWRSSNAAGGPMLAALARLEDRRLESFLLDPVGLDLVMRFEGGLRLSVFGDCMEEDDGDNYCVFDARTSYAACFAGRVLLEERRSR